MGGFLGWLPGFNSGYNLQEYYVDAVSDISAKRGRVLTFGLATEAAVGLACHAMPWLLW